MTRYEVIWQARNGETGTEMSGSGRRGLSGNVGGEAGYGMAGGTGQGVARSV